MATNQNSQSNQGSNQGQGQGSNQGNQGSSQRGFGSMDDQQQRDIARKGGQTSANEQDRDSQGQFTGSTGSGSSMGGPSGGQADRDQSGQRRDDQGQFTSGQQSGDRGGQGGSNR